MKRTRIHLFILYSFFMSDYEIQDTDTGASEATAIPVNKLRKGGYCLIEGRPCRVIEISKSKTGKHGHAKAGIAGTDIFTGRRYETHVPTSHDIEVPFVSRTDYVLLNIDGRNTQLLAADGTTNEDVLMPTDEKMLARINELYDSGDEVLVTVLASGKESIIVDARKNQNS
jgi:translation initiation factor 5A